MIEKQYLVNKKDLEILIQVLIDFFLFIFKGKKYPGPGNYKSTDVINSHGQYFYSKMQSAAVRKFGSSKRPPLDLPKSYNVGPGQYRAPSEFGYY